MKVDTDDYRDDSLQATLLQIMSLRHNCFDKSKVLPYAKGLEVAI